MDWEDSVFALYQDMMISPSLEEVNEPKISDFGNSWIAWSLRHLQCPYT